MRAREKGRYTSEVDLAMGACLHEITDIVHEGDLDAVVNFEMRRDAPVDFVSAFPLNEI